ncbi:MAG: hypothetical protein M0D54_19430 [Hyphomonadaceae bacterium JAD_PAG50586_4]|nr:MAG: hypothetical protein M0D54_19430 [Hyphomonadaceae bacterium JAD_PAG50586_4]
MITILGRVAQKIAGSKIMTAHHQIADRDPGLLCDLELHRPPGLLLHDDTAVLHFTAGGDIRIDCKDR